MYTHHIDGKRFFYLANSGWGGVTGNYNLR